MALRTPLFTQHSRSWRTNRYVYPVISRRSHGLSIGVNLNPDKACNFDCVYCSVDRTTPGAERAVDLRVLRAELTQLLELAVSGALFDAPPFDQTPPALRRLNDVAFSGDGEPTAAAEFGPAARLAVEVVAAAGAACRLVVITNATLLRRPEVAATLAYLDAHDGEVWAKLDAGTERYFHQIERTEVPFARILDNLTACARARATVIQSLFCRLEGAGPSAAEIEAYRGCLRRVRDAGGRIARVQVYTTARATAVASVTPLPDAEIDAIVAGVRADGFAAEGFYGPAETPAGEGRPRAADGSAPATPPHP